MQGGDVGGGRGGKGGKGKPGPGSNGCLAGKFPGPTAKPYIYTANGCGPQGMQVKENFGLHVCCNNHDLCYGVCGTTFGYCEAQFGKCMKAVCEKHGGEKASECNQQAQSFTGMTRMFGGGMHQSSQVDACDCFDSKETAAQRHLEHITGLYQRNNPEKAKDKAFIAGLLERSKGKEGPLTTRVLQNMGSTKCNLTVSRPSCRPIPNCRPISNCG